MSSFVSLPRAKKSRSVILQRFDGSTLLPLTADTAVRVRQRSCWRSSDVNGAVLVPLARDRARSCYGAAISELLSTSGMLCQGLQAAIEVNAVADTYIQPSPRVAFSRKGHLRESFLGTIGALLLEPPPF